MSKRIPFNRGRNEKKREFRARCESLKGMPGGWKKALRIQDETARMMAKAMP